MVLTIPWEKSRQVWWQSLVEVVISFQVQIFSLWLAAQALYNQCTLCECPAIFTLLSNVRSSTILYTGGGNRGKEERFKGVWVWGCLRRGLVPLRPDAVPAGLLPVLPSLTSDTLCHGGILVFWKVMIWTWEKWSWIIECPGRAVLPPVWWWPM